MPSQLDLTVIGPGAVGRSLLLSAKEAGYRITSVFRNKDSDSLSGSDSDSGSGSGSGADTSRLSGVQQFTGLEQVSEENLGRCIFLTTPDDQIRKVTGQLSAAPVKWESRIVVHCSGALDSGVLNDLAERGAATASFHPMQTFTEESSSDSFRRIYVTIEGDRRALKLLKDFAEKIGSTPLELTRDQKTSLHIAAVFLSNYLVSLGGFAESLINNSSAEPGLKLFQPLILQTVKNMTEKGPKRALTGPVKRGDTETVRLHLERLAKEDLRPELVQAYSLLGLEALRLSDGEGKNSSRSSIEKLLKENR